METRLLDTKTVKMETGPIETQNTWKQQEKTDNNGVLISRMDVKTAYDKLHENMEPCFQGEWRRYPWSARDYVSVDRYVVAEDVGEEMDKEILLQGLTTSLQGDDCDILETGTLALQRTIKLSALPPRCVMNKDVQERCVWGLDCFTRQLLHDCLSLCPELMESRNDEIDVRVVFIEKHLLPSLNRLGENGWNLFAAMEGICRSASEKGNSVLEKTAERMLQLMQCLERREWSPPAPETPNLSNIVDITDNFRAHPKGQGVICCRPGGLPKGTFVEEYLGEVYPPWRWFERQDALKKINPDSTLPDFYNIQIERPRIDDLGYGIIFVEGANRGNFASRLCHSCSPNCQTVSVCAEGRVTNAMFTARDIADGEELTWDYSCVTESEKEYRSAVCLCGTAICRGSFLYYADSSAFRDVMSVEHTFLDRTALLLCACSQPLGKEDWERLNRNGIKKYALQAENNPDTLVPDWLIKWASLILDFIESENKQLPEKLMERQLSSKFMNRHKSYTQHSAFIESIGVKTNRLQNLAITLDKAKYFLRKQQNKGPPLFFLSDEEIVHFLWSSSDSVANQAVKAILEYYDRLRRNQAVFELARQKLETQDTTRDRTSDNDDEILVAQVQKLMAFVERLEPKTPEDARNGLLKICEMLRQTHGVHVALHDAVFLKANTRHFFTARRYETVKSVPVVFSSADLPREHMETTNGSRPGAKKRRRLMNMQSKKYRAEFLWAQLVGWFKQTVYEPTASLGAERRGSVCLPSVENCYAEPVMDGTYLNRQRPNTIRIMEQRPDAQWPTGMIWSYKNSERVYGTPMLDVAINRACKEIDPNSHYRRMLEEFKSVFAANAFDVA